MALSGLLTCILFILYPKHLINELRMDLILTSEKSAIMSLTINAELAAIQRKIKRLEIEKPAPDEIGKLWDITSALKSLELKKDINKETQATYTKLHMFKNERINELVGLMFIGIAISISLSLSGFLLWYRRVQRPLDKKLEEEALTGYTNTVTPVSFQHESSIYSHRLSRRIQR